MIAHLPELYHSLPPRRRRAALINCPVISLKSFSLFLLFLLIILSIFILAVEIFWPTTTTPVVAQNNEISPSRFPLLNENLIPKEKKFSTTTTMSRKIAQQWKDQEIIIENRLKSIIEEDIPPLGPEKEEVEENISLQESIEIPSPNASPSPPSYSPKDLLSLHQDYFSARRLYFYDQRDLLLKSNDFEEIYWSNHSLGEILSYNDSYHIPRLWTQERYQGWKNASLKAKVEYQRRQGDYRRLRAKMAEIHGPSWEAAEGSEEETRPSNIFDIQIMIITGRRTMRSRLENFMHTVGKEIPYGHIWFITDVIGSYDDSDDEKASFDRFESNFPLIPVMEYEMNYAESQRKWLPGLNYLLNIGFSMPSMASTPSMASSSMPSMPSSVPSRWYLVLDDDSLFFPANYLSFINHSKRNQDWSKKPAYYGRLCSLEDERIDIHQRFCGGGGWTFNQAMAKKLYQTVQSTCSPFLYLGQASHYLSACLQKAYGIPLTPALEFNTHPLSYYLTFSPGGLMDFPRGNGKIVTVHYLSLDYQEIRLKSDRQKWLHYYQFYAAFTRQEEESDRETTY